MLFKIEIKNRWSGRVQFTAEVEAAVNASAELKLGGAAIAAYQSDADLSDAVLRDADLSGADLSGADLSDADLSDADLRGAVLRDADLSGADLSGADLSDAVLSGADLSDAVLSGADLSDAVLREILEKEVPLIPNIDAQILASIEKNKAAGTNGLEMGGWHGGKEDEIDETNWCSTTHCRAGYAICLAGKEGFALEKKYGPATAGMLLYMKSTPEAPIPNFYCGNDEAMADIKARAAKQTGSVSLTAPHKEDAGRTVTPDIKNWTRARIEALPSKDLGAIVRSTAPEGKFARERIWANNELLRRAAPDLLEALKLARQCIAYCRRAHKDAQSGEGIPAEVFIDAAISKATGTSP